MRKKSPSCLSAGAVAGPSGGPAGVEAKNRPQTPVRMIGKKLALKFQLGFWSSLPVHPSARVIVTRCFRLERPHMEPKLLALQLTIYIDPVGHTSLLC